MLNWLIRFSLAQRSLIFVTTIIILVMSVRQLLQLPVEVLPDLTKPTVTIMTEAPGYAPEEVETLITIPLENALMGVNGVTRLRSTNDISLSLIFVEFEWDTTCSTLTVSGACTGSDVTIETSGSALPSSPIVTACTGGTFLTTIDRAPAILGPELSCDPAACPYQDGTGRASCTCSAQCVCENGYGGNNCEIPPEQCDPTGCNWENGGGICGGPWGSGVPSESTACTCTADWESPASFCSCFVGDAGCGANREQEDCTGLCECSAGVDEWCGLCPGDQLPDGSIYFGGGSGPCP